MPKVVLITGASSGIGRATAIALVKDGYKVAGTARRMERLQDLQREIAAMPDVRGAFLPIENDVTRQESVQAAVKKTVEAFGELDVLVANAGVGHRGAVADAAWSDLETLLRTNIDGVLHSIRACVPEMRKAGGGHIVVISSVTFNLVSPYAATYAASKAFVSSLAHSLRMELKDDDITVTDMLVGRTETEFNANRLGEGKRTGEGIPTMSADKVAAGIVQAIKTRSETVTLRLFDRLIIWASRLFPRLVGQLAMRQYK